MHEIKRGQPQSQETPSIANIQKNPEYLTKNEASAWIKVTTTSITNYINSGQLKSYRIGGRVLIEKSDLANLIHERIITKPITK